ncbi:MAG: Ppx/GppA family phosphatase [Actinobacteria bacterium ATB1]|nr:Ppx/GppA family phosphatase [Actinobacteria bacterium ATB1]
MSRAAVDIGTNSVRLLVVDDTGAEVERHMRITRLGKGVDANGNLDREAIDRTLAVLVEYAARLEANGVSAVRAAATSAVRDAGNASEFVGPASEVLGVVPEVISGLEEAALSFAGATAGLGREGAPFLVVDIGGGSTELIFGSTDPEGATSLDMGCVRVSERHLHSDPPAPAELNDARRMVEDLLTEAVRVLPDERANTLVGLAGTVSTLAAMNVGLRSYDPSATHHSSISREELAAMLDRLASTPLVTRRSLIIEPERADVIVGGAVVLATILDVFGFGSVLVSEHDILDGLVASIDGSRESGVDELAT